MQWTEDDVNKRLETLRVDWSTCSKCNLFKTRKNVVFGRGNPSADLLFVGEAPGEMEDISGIPFHPNGASGGILLDLLEAVGIASEDYFITNTVACRPPENRDPSTEEKKACFTRLQQLIYLIDPLIIIPVGKPAMTTLIKGQGTSVLSNQGKLFESKIQGVYTEIIYPAIPIVHPSYIIRSDSIDTRTQQWSQGGPFATTLGIMLRIKELLDFLRDAYKRHKRTLRVLNNE